MRYLNHNSHVLNMSNWRSIHHCFTALYLDEFIKVAKRELGWEVDYIREAENTRRFKKLLENMPDYKVPGVVGKNNFGTHRELYINWFLLRWVVYETDLHHGICWRNINGTSHGNGPGNEKSCRQKNFVFMSHWTVWIPFHANWSKLGQFYVRSDHPSSKLNRISIFYHKFILNIFIYLLNIRRLTAYIRQ